CEVGEIERLAGAGAGGVGLTGGAGTVWFLFLQRFFASAAPFLAFLHFFLAAIVVPLSGSADAMPTVPVASSRAAQRRAVERLLSRARLMPGTYFRALINRSSRAERRSGLAARADLGLDVGCHRRGGRAAGNRGHRQGGRDQPGALGAHANVDR